MHASDRLISSILVFLLTLTLSLSLSLASSSPGWDELFHAACHNASIQAHHRNVEHPMNGTLLVEQCKSCVTATIEQNGDASRCHSCLHSMASYEIRASCLTCVPSAEKLKLGWACAQYCTHHHIISTKGEAEQCQGCLMNQEIKDKWGCHVCMEQIPGSEIETRQGCFNCLANGGRTSSGSGLYLCAACGRVRDSMKRRECYRCLKEDTESGSSCLSRHNVSLKYNKPPSRAAEIIDRLRSHPPPH